MSGLFSGLRRSSERAPSIPNGDLEPIPDFPPDASYDTKLKQLNRGPTFAIHFGSGPALFSISQRLLIYHSPQTCHDLLVNQHQTTINLREEEGDTYNHLHHFLTTSHLSIPLRNSQPSSEMSGPEREKIRQDITEACTTLLRVHRLCVGLGIEGAFRSMVEGQLRCATDSANELGMSTPFSGTIVMETYRAMERGEETSQLWEFVLDELSTAFSRPPPLIWADYEECFLIPSLNKCVFEHMHARIVELLGKQAVPAGEDDGERTVTKLQPNHVVGENLIPESSARDSKRKRSTPVGEQEEDAYVEVHGGPVDLKRLKFDAAGELATEQGDPADAGEVTEQDEDMATGYGDPMDAGEVTEQDEDMEQGESGAWEGTTEPEHDGDAEED